jgi:hypothetical protein
MGKKSDLFPEFQKFVKTLLPLFSKEKAAKKPIVSFDREYQRTSKALGVSYTSVHRSTDIYTISVADVHSFLLSTIFA